jgi:hypothetical protein
MPATSTVRLIMRPRFFNESEVNFGAVGPPDPHQGELNQNLLPDLAPALTGLSEIANAERSSLCTRGYKSDIRPAYHRQKSEFTLSQ